MTLPALVVYFAPAARMVRLAAAFYRAYCGATAHISTHGAALAVRTRSDRLARRYFAF